MMKENPDLLISMMKEDLKSKKMPMQEEKGQVTLIVDGEEVSDPKEIAKYVYENMPEELEACKEEKGQQTEDKEESGDEMMDEEEDSLAGLNLR